MDKPVRIRMCGDALLVNDLFITAHAYCLQLTFYSAHLLQSWGVPPRVHSLEKVNRGKN